MGVCGKFDQFQNDEEVAFVSKNEKFVKSVYPLAEMQPTISGVRLRIVSEPSIRGTWLGKSFYPEDRNKWKSAAEYVREEMLRKLES
jgi:hypothetical protein